MPKGILAPGTPQCTAHKRSSGDRCKLPAIKGGTVCRRHGGSAPQVQRSARERFNDAIDPAINLMHKQLERAANGELSVAEEQNLMKLVFDRTGFVPGKQVNIDGKAKWEITLADIIREAPAELTGVVDAEVVEDEDDEDEDALARHEREEAERRRIALKEQERDRARAALPQIGERREAHRVGSAEPPRRRLEDFLEQ